MKHFICTGGCDDESSKPGVCQTEGCKKEGEPLLACGCFDGSHDILQEEHNEKDENNN